MDKPPKGKHLTKGLDKKVPQESEFTKWRDEVVVPCGKPVDSKVKMSELMYNEYIVYNTAQVSANQALFSDVVKHLALVLLVYVPLSYIAFNSLGKHCPGSSEPQKCSCYLEFQVEDRLGNLESENKVLRQEALTIEQTNKLLASRSRSIMQELCSQSLNSRDTSDLEGGAQKPLNEKQQENQDLLIRSVAQQLDFARGRPTSACIILKCLRQWRSFEVEHTRIFDRIVQTIGQAMEVGTLKMTTHDALPLRGSSKLKKSSGAAGTTQHQRSTSATHFGMTTQSFLGIPRGVNISSVDGEIIGAIDSTLMHIEAKYPALLFKQQVTAYVEKIYAIIRDNLKKEISPLLGLCIRLMHTDKAQQNIIGYFADKQHKLLTLF
ncbi:hypothetical protein Ancab_019190 [Ancistrocladus abbreviatus]